MAKQTPIVINTTPKAFRKESEDRDQSVIDEVSANMDAFAAFGVDQTTIDKWQKKLDAVKLIK